MPVLFDKLVFLEDPEPREGTTQMAVDEHLLVHATEPTLRVYRWIRPTVSLGYFENLAAAREKFIGRREGGLDFVRRWTGGGAVLHESDFTYALIVPRSHAFALSRPAESYRIIHRLLAMALSEVGISVDLVAQNAGPQAGNGSGNGNGNGICFESPVESDVLFEGRKISGAGQRRSKIGLLHQGTIQGIDAPRELGPAFANQLASKVQQGPAPDWRAVDAGKYESREWLERR